jgi:hypothetical protein
MKVTKEDITSDNLESRRDTGPHMLLTKMGIMDINNLNKRWDGCEEVWKDVNA